MYLQDLLCTFAFATLTAAAVAKQVPQPGWDKYAGERHGQHHEGQHQGHVHAREAEAEAEANPAQRAAWEHAHGGPAPTYKWTVPTGTHGFPTAWPTKVPQFEHAPHHARDAMPEPEPEAEADAAQHRSIPRFTGNPVHHAPAFPGHKHTLPHQARDAMPEAESGFGHHTHGHHAQHTGAWTEPAAWKSWLSAHPSPTHGAHHARDAEAEPGFPGFEHHDHEHGAHPAHSASWSHPTGTGSWTKPAAWKSWFSSPPRPTGAPHHARDAEAEPDIKEGLEKFGEKMQHGFEKFGHKVEDGVKHIARDVPVFDDEDDVDTSLDGYGDLHARDAEPEADA